MMVKVVMLLGLALASATAANIVTTCMFPSRTIFQFEYSGTWIENIAARENGDLLFTVLQPSPRLYTLVNPSIKTPTAELIYEFPNMTGLLGITETDPNLFAVVGGKFNGTAIPVNDTFSIWEVDFRQAGEPKVTKTMDFPFLLFPNGLESVPGKSGIVMLANSLGSLIRVDLNNGTMTVVAELPEMKPTSNAALTIGINGINIRDRYIYWTNSFASTIYRLPISEEGLIEAPAQVETVAVVPETFLDDFAIGAEGTMWAATNPNNTVVAVSFDGKKKEVAIGAQNSAVAAGATAATFGRTKADKHILYVVTTGGLASPVNGTFVEPGKVIAIDTEGFSF